MEKYQRAGIRLVFLFAVASCATTAQDFKPGSLRSDQGAVVGKIAVIYNGKPYSENCTVKIADATYQLGSDGLVLMSAKKGWHSFDRIECKDTSIYHYDLKGARFYNQGDGWASYFGDVVLEWRTDGGFKGLS